MTSDIDPSTDVMVELHPSDAEVPQTADQLAAGLDGFSPDLEFEPVPMTSGPDGQGPTVIIRGSMDASTSLEELAASPGVVRVWLDTPTAPFDPSDMAF